MSSQPLQIGGRPDKERIAERAKLVRQAKLLAWLGVGWHGIEAAIAVVAQLGDAAHVTAALTGWKASRATIHLLGDAPRLPRVPAGAIRLLEQSELASLAGLPPHLRSELRIAARRSPIATGLEGSRPVSFC